MGCLLSIAQFPWFFMCWVILACILGIWGIVLFRPGSCRSPLEHTEFLAVFAGHRHGMEALIETAHPAWPRRTVVSVSLVLSGLAVLIWAWAAWCADEPGAQARHRFVSRIRASLTSSLLSRALSTLRDPHRPLSWCSGQTMGLGVSCLHCLRTALWLEYPWGTARRGKWVSPAHTLQTSGAYFPGPPPSETASVGVRPAARPRGSLHRPLATPWSWVPGPRSSQRRRPLGFRTPATRILRRGAVRDGDAFHVCHTFVFITLWICVLLHIQHLTYI